MSMPPITIHAWKQKRLHLQAGNLLPAASKSYRFIWFSLLTWVTKWQAIFKKMVKGYPNFINSVHLLHPRHFVLGFVLRFVHRQNFLSVSEFESGAATINNHAQSWKVRWTWQLINDTLTDLIFSWQPTGSSTFGYARPWPDSGVTSVSTFKSTSTRNIYDGLIKKLLQNSCEISVWWSKYEE